MKAWVSCTGAALLARDAADWAAQLSYAQAGQLSEVQRAQRESWGALIVTLQAALREAGGESWQVLLEVEMLRLERRIDAVLLTDRAVLVLEYKHGATGFAAPDLAQVEDYALDLFDFHAASRAHPVVPLLLASGAAAPVNQWPIFLPGVTTPVLRASPASLGALLRGIQAAIPAPAAPLDAAAWEAAPYRPVPTIIEAARRLFDRHGVEAIATARADARNLTRTTAAIRAAIGQARAEGARRVVFVTGIPGAGKTLCGLNLAFGPAAEGSTAFLTGNAPLVAVLRGALERDAREAQGRGARQPRREARAVLQNVHRFLEHHVRHPAEAPPEHVVVFDEAQRAWDAAQAGRDTQRRSSILTTSEPGHMLEIMARVPGWSVIVALIGNGQEINTGEAGLAEWGRVIGASWAKGGGGLWGRWRRRARSPPRSRRSARRRATRHGSRWRRIWTSPYRCAPSTTSAARNGWRRCWRSGRRKPPPSPPIVPRGRAALLPDARPRRAAGRAARPGAGLRRAGLVCSAKAKRLRAEGLGAQLHGADDEVVNWFLNRWPDVRGSDALEVCATEYACQGLELDVVGRPGAATSSAAPRAGRPAASPGRTGSAWPRPRRGATCATPTACC
ncbi:DNA/RNA helicase domain-containing protein [Teichococcus aestuarii]|uniref:DNA/RNA helicase domain-containing protein n=1 Tax=Teichococcus aestuarii TaxID=568898 RepID=UPI00360D047B